jgi:hypothetical protein
VGPKIKALNHNFTVFVVNNTVVTSPYVVGLEIKAYVPCSWLQLAAHARVEGYVFGYMPFVLSLSLSLSHSVLSLTCMLFENLAWRRGIGSDYSPVSSTATLPLLHLLFALHLVHRVCVRERECTQAGAVTCAVPAAGGLRLWPARRRCACSPVSLCVRACIVVLRT